MQLTKISFAVLSILGLLLAGQGCDGDPPTGGAGDLDSDSDSDGDADSDSDSDTDADGDCVDGEYPSEPHGWYLDQVVSTASFPGIFGGEEMELSMEEAHCQQPKSLVFVLGAET